MAWSGLASNQMVSYTDAQGGGFTLNSGQSAVTSNQMMDKTAALTKYNLNATNMSAYAGNQLVPKSAWVAAVTGPIFVANSNFAVAISTSTVNVTYPTSVLAGDFILLIVSAETSTSTTTPSGFTIMTPSTVVNSQFSAMYYKIANGTEGSTSVSVTTIGSSTSAAIIKQYRNVNTTTPFGTRGALNFSSSSVFSNSSVLQSSTVANSLGITVWNVQYSALSGQSMGTWSYSGGGSTTQGTGHTIVSAHQSLPTSGSNGGVCSITATVATYASVWGFVLNPV
jgi:hypothetical protein